MAGPVQTWPQGRQVVCRPTPADAVADTAELTAKDVSVCVSAGLNGEALFSPPSGEQSLLCIPLYDRLHEEVEQSGARPVKDLRQN